MTASAVCRVLLKGDEYILKLSAGMPVPWKSWKIQSCHIIHNCGKHSRRSFSYTANGAPVQVRYKAGKVLFHPKNVDVGSAKEPSCPAAITTRVGTKNKGDWELMKQHRQITKRWHRCQFRPDEPKPCSLKLSFLPLCH